MVKSCLFANTTIMVVGDLMMDRTWYGKTERISPETPAPILDVNAIVDRPGGAANVALNLAILGVNVILMGIVGDDEAGEKLKANLLAYGINCVFYTQKDYATTIKLRLVDNHHQLIRADFEQPSNSIMAFDALSYFESLIQDVDAVIFSDYCKGALSDMTQLVAKGKKRKIMMACDPKAHEPMRYLGMDVLTPNFYEFQTICHQLTIPTTDIDKAASMLAKTLKLKHVLLKKGKHGMTLYSRGVLPVHISASSLDVYDVTGAGDTVIATLIACHQAGHAMSEAAALANLAAGIVVGQQGTSAVTTKQLFSRYQQSHAIGGLVDQTELLKQVNIRRLAGHSIAMTNGCFDILHAGHLATFKHAKSKASSLIVAINDDASIKRLKGDSRPIHSIEHRVAMLLALEDVDWVIVFGQDTPESIIEAAKPDWLIKGGDYTPNDIAGAQFVQSYGGQVDVVPLIESLSTTRSIRLLGCD